MGRLRSKRRIRRSRHARIFKKMKFYFKWARIRLLRGWRASWSFPGPCFGPLCLSRQLSSAAMFKLNYLKINVQQWMLFRLKG